MEKDFTWGGEPTIQYTDDVLYNCTPETYIVLLTKVTPINSIKNLFLNNEGITLYANFYRRKFVFKTSFISQLFPFLIFQSG